MQHDPTYSLVPWLSALISLQVPGNISSGSTRLHASNPNLSTAALLNGKADPEPLDSPFDVAKLQEDFYSVAANCEWKLLP